MILNLIYVELLKYRRTVIPWMILVGASLASGTSLLLVASENAQVDWGSFSVSSLNCINLLALLLVAVFTGLVFVGEYHENRDVVLFTYPVSRIKVFVSKLAVVYIMDISLFLLFFIFAMLFGLAYIGSFPVFETGLKLFEMTMVLTAVHFVLVPVTVLISILVKGTGTYIFAGMCYFMLFISLIKSDFSTFIPVCIPDKLVTNYFISTILSSSDLTGIILVCVITLLTAFSIGAACYCRQDV